MDAYDHGDPDGSQATQMIQDLLERDPSPSKHNDSRSSALKTQNHHSNEMSSDSLPSSRTSHSIPQYHFHGLASTQTQSQHHEEDKEPAEGSQKENIGTTKDSPPLQASSPQASSSRNVAAKALAEDHPGDAAEKGPTKKTTNVTFQSPRPKGGVAANATRPNTRQNPSKAPVAAPSRYKQPPRPPVRTASQDSFACEPEVNREFFVAKADKFVVPLSELGGSSPARASRDLDITSGTSVSGDSMYSYSMNTRLGVPKSPPRGRVLVESTPSNSSESQSQPSQDQDISRSVSQRFEEGKFAFQHVKQLVPEHRNVNSYPASFDIHPDLQASPPEIHPDLLATQPSGDAELEATQPSTQPEDPIFHGAATTPSSIFQSVIPSGASGSRNLMSLVPAENHYRYRHYGNAQNSKPFVVQSDGSRVTNESDPIPATIPSEYEETQPSFPEAPPPRRGFPIKSFTVTTADSLHSTAPVDSMEVVPDSEPSRQRLSPTKPLFAQPQQIQPSMPAPATRGKVAAVQKDVEMRVAAVDDVEEDDEEEIPLAKAVAAAPVKRRGRPPGTDKKAVNSKGKEKELPPPSRVAQGKQKAPAKFAQNVVMPAGNGHGRSLETAEVPSSMPEQDVPKNTRSTRNRPVVITEAKRQATQKRPESKQSSRSTSNAPRSRQHEQEEEAEDEDEDMSHERDKEDEETEPADEEYQESYQEDEAGPSRKRKRTDKADMPAKGTRAGTGKRTKRGGATPGTRANGRPLQSGTSTGVRSVHSQGTRVFALWTQDGHYYPGIVHSTDNHSRYNVKFEDGTDAWVNIDDMRICELHVGDDVLFGDRNRPARVVNIDSHKDGFVKVSLDDKTQEKATRELRIAHKTILFAWDDRKLTPQTVSTTVKPVKKRVTPSPSKMSMVAVPTIRGNRKKVLARTGLIVTLSAANGSWEKEKGNVMNAVKNSGGFVIDDLNTIIKMEGKLSASNNRWIIEKSDVKWIGNEDIERLFLVADDPNQKPKFLIALALGIPCLSTSWLQESVEIGEEKEWFGYMLPQGYSSALKARPSQQVDVDWGNSIHQLSDIMNNYVACKLFAGKSVLCVGADMVMPPKGKKRAGEEKALEASTAVPRIILAMGAQVVEAVTEARYASKAFANYDYLVVRESFQYLPQFSACTTVHWTWVKDCLIASRLLPLPVWPKFETVDEEDYSQEIA